MHSAGLVHRDLKPANLLLNAECLVKVCDFGLCRTVSDIAKGEEEYTNLTDYVATRWYRAPEILLASKKYKESVDMWSLGTLPSLASRLGAAPQQPSTAPDASLSTQAAFGSHSSGRPFPLVHPSAVAAAGCIFAEMMNGKPIFPGTSTLNQLERVIEKIGFPSESERKSIETQYSKTMLENLTTGPDSARKEWKELLPSAPPDAISFVSRLITWAPEARLTAEDALSHAYCVRFHEAGTELKWPEDKPKPAAELRFNDCEKKSAAQYRNALYDNIRENKELVAIRQKLR